MPSIILSKSVISSQPSGVGGCDGGGVQGCPSSIANNLAASSIANNVVAGCGGETSVVMVVSWSRRKYLSIKQSSLLWRCKNESNSVEVAAPPEALLSADGHCCPGRLST